MALAVEPVVFCDMSSAAKSRTCSRLGRREQHLGMPKSRGPQFGTREFLFTAANLGSYMSDRTNPAQAKSISISQKTIIQWNIARFRNLLLTELDPERRTLLSKLLAEEQAKLVTQLFHEQGGRPAAVWT
jgi:hypothetical protein